MPSTYDIRLIQAGRIIEKIEYENPVIVKQKIIKKSIMTCIKKNNGRKQSASEIDKLKNREIILYRALNEVRRLVNANVNRYENQLCNNYHPVFLTLTFADNIKDISLANRNLLNAWAIM